MLRNCDVLIVACAVGLGLSSSVGNAETKNQTPKKENAMTQAAATQPSTQALASDAIRPFRVNIPEQQIADLRRRIAATRWPTKELVEDRSQGVQLATLRELARYWSTDYDWRKCEARLNALPQFTTEIDGVDIHFIHVRSRHENALPLIMTHGWPGSVIELLETVGPADRPDRARRHRRATHSTWCCRPCPATASRASRPSSAGSPAASPARGRS